MKNFKKSFELKIKRHISEEGIFTKGEHLLLAVSGGPDSLCMLILMNRWAKSERWKLKVAYFDHQLRDASRKEAAHVQQRCKMLHVACVEGRGDTQKFKQTKKLSLEESARLLRYQFLKKEARKFNHAKIVLAHHLNDQVETFFVSLLKGAGLGGLSGMKPLDGRLARPLLTVTKKEILRYLEIRNIHYCVDETNLNEMILRNKVRAKLLPFLEQQFAWNIYKTLPRMMRVWKAEHETLESVVSYWFSERIEKKAYGYAMGVKTFLQSPVSVQRRIIKRIVDKLSTKRHYSSMHIERNRRLFMNPVSGKKVLLPEGIIAEKSKEEVVWRSFKPNRLEGDNPS